MDTQLVPWTSRLRMPVCGRSGRWHKQLPNLVSLRLLLLESPARQRATDDPSNGCTSIGKVLASHGGTLRGIALNMPLTDKVNAGLRRMRLSAFGCGYRVVGGVWLSDYGPWLLLLASLRRKGKVSESVYLQVSLDIVFVTTVGMRGRGLAAFLFCAAHSEKHATVAMCIGQGWLPPDFRHKMDAGGSFFAFCGVASCGGIAARAHFVVFFVVCSADHRSSLSQRAFSLRTDLPPPAADAACRICLLPFDPLETRTCSDESPVCLASCPRSTNPHCFHARCLSDWMTSHSNCPICRVVSPNV